MSIGERHLRELAKLVTKRLGRAVETQRAPDGVTFVVDGERVTISEADLRAHSLDVTVQRIMNRS